MTGSTSRKPKVLWLSDANAAHTIRWARALAEAGVELLVFSLTEPYFAREWEASGVSLETGGVSPDVAYSSDGGWRKLAYLRSVGRVRNLYRQFQPDLVHAHYVSSYGLLATISGLRPRVVSAWGCDVYTTPFISAIHRHVVCSVLRSADMVLSTSHTMRDQVYGLVEREIHVVPFGIDVQRFQPRSIPLPANHEVRLGTVKSMETKYGLEYLVRAYALLRQRRPLLASRLVIVGGGVLGDALKGLVRELGLTETTDFVGRVEYESVHKCHQALDVAIYPSIDDSESFGVSVVESQACGVPVIVSEIGGLPEVIDRGKSGLVVPPRDPVAIADALEFFIDNPEARAAFGRAGRARVLRDYSLQDCVQALIGRYRQVVV